MKKINLDENLMKSLYLEGKKSCKEIGKILNTSETTIAHYLRKFGVIRDRSEAQTLKYDSNILNKIDEKWKAYFLGWIWSDGNLYGTRVTIRLQERDKYILDYFNEKLFNGVLNIRYYKPIKVYNKKTNKTYQGNPQYQLAFNNKMISNKLRDFGLYENKSLTIGYPKLTQFHSDFIRGMFEGDGSVNIHFRGNSILFHANICGNKTLLTDIQNILKQNDINMNIHQDKENLWKLCTPNKKTFIQFYHYLYPDDCFSLLRKREKFEKALKHWKDNDRIILWPSLEKLQEMINSQTYIEIAKPIGVHWKTLVTYLKKNGIERKWETRTNLIGVHPKGKRFFYRFRFNRKIYEKYGFLTPKLAAIAYDREYFEVTGKTDRLNNPELFL